MICPTSSTYDRNFDASTGRTFVDTLRATSTPSASLAVLSSARAVCSFARIEILRLSRVTNSSFWRVRSPPSVPAIVVEPSSLISVVTARLYRGSVDVGGNGGGIEESSSSSSSSSSMGVLGVPIGLNESLKRNKY